jgi:beta-lactamase regulating signal transducer with metallopeptidase domain
MNNIMTLLGYIALASCVISVAFVLIRLYATRSQLEPQPEPAKKATKVASAKAQPKKKVATVKKTATVKKAATVKKTARPKNS